MHTKVSQRAQWEDLRFFVILLLKKLDFFFRKESSLENPSG